MIMSIHLFAAFVNGQNYVVCARLGQTNHMDCAVEQLDHHQSIAS